MKNKMMKKVAIVIAAVTMAIAGSAVAANAEPCNKTAVVTAGDYLAFRAEPNAESRELGRFEHGQGIVVIDTNDYNGWSKVGYNAQEGYVCSRYISIYNEGQTYTGTTDDHGFKADSNIATKREYTVSVAPGTYLALRNDFSSSDSSIIGQLYNGQKVSVIQGNGKFWYVDAPSVGRVGYVNSNYLV